MACAVRVPRVNNNDDQVTLVALHVARGDRVRRDQLIAQVETDKAVVDIESVGDGVVLSLAAAPGDRIEVGSVLAWLGETADEAVPVSTAAAREPLATGQPTAKARALLEAHGLAASDVPASGERLGVADIERFLAARAPASPAAADDDTLAAGRRVPLRGPERGMLATVSWHRDTAAAGYIEIGYAHREWEAYAKDFASQHGLLLNPLLPLMCWQLVQAAQRDARLNATIVGQMRHEYAEVALGVAVQVDSDLYLAVLHGAGALDRPAFVSAFVELQRAAAAGRLTPAQSRGATLGFSSMARWKATRHMPVLAPHTSLMVGHTVGADGAGVLGASYDHRVLNGLAVVDALRALALPQA